MRESKSVVQMGLFGKNKRIKKDPVKLDQLPDPVFEFMSFGAGVQSTYILMQMVAGNIKKIPLIFADTGSEPDPVYRHLERCVDLAEKNGISISIVGSSSLKDDFIDSVILGKELGHQRGNIPLHFWGSDGQSGILKRGCTDISKIREVEKEVKRILGISDWGKAGRKTVRQYFGISVDEIERMRVSKIDAVAYFYPLIIKNSTSERKLIYQRPGITRSECDAYNIVNKFPAPRSACYFCPLRRNSEWLRMKIEDPKSWALAVEFDNQIGTATTFEHPLFVHHSKTPLAEADLKDDSDRDLPLFIECSGMCGI